MNEIERCLEALGVALPEPAAPTSESGVASQGQADD